MQKIIQWDKWEDPLIEITELDSFKDEEEQDRLNYKGSIILSPFGLIMNKVFNFWIMHTNFKINREVYNILNNFDGVETFNVLSPYRASLSFGKVFDEKEVMNNIEKVLCHKEVKSSKIDNIKMLKESLSKKYKFWCIIINNKNEIETFGSEAKDNVLKKIQENPNAKTYLSW